MKLVSSNSFTLNFMNNIKMSNKIENMEGVSPWFGKIITETPKFSKKWYSDFFSIIFYN